MLSSPSLMWQFADEHVGAGDVEAVGVRAVGVGVDGEIADGDVAALFPEAAVMAGRAGERDVVDEQAFAGIKVKQHRTRQIAVGATFRPPCSTLTVKCAAPADFQIRRVIRGDERGRIGASAGILAKGQHHQPRAVIQPQINATAQCQRAAQVFARRELDDAAARRARGGDGVLDIRRVVLHAIAEGAELGDIEYIRGNGRQRRIHGAGCVAVQQQRNQHTDE